MTAVEVLPVTGLGEIEPGADLAALIAAAADLRDADVVVVAQKVVSKAEAALRTPEPGEDPTVARRRIAREIADVVAETEAVLITRTAHGFVCANAGIDASNVPGAALTLLPDDPDASALRLRERLRSLAGVDVAVIVADTFGRAWRVGQTDVAIGTAGLRPLRDERGARDRQGRVLDVTEVAVADELAAAADLVRRKADGIPVVLVRGFPWERDEEAGARALVRDVSADLFAHGTGGLAALLSAGETPAGDPVPAADLDRAWVAATRVAGGAVTLLSLTPAAPGPTRVGVRADSDPAVAGVAAGVLAVLLADTGYKVRLERPVAGEPVAAVVVAWKPTPRRHR